MAMTFTVLGSGEGSLLVPLGYNFDDHCNAELATAREKASSAASTSVV